MTAIRSQYSRVLSELLAIRRQAFIESMALGIPGDYPAYRQLVGQVQGIDDALKCAEEADFKISGDEPNAGA